MLMSCQGDKGNRCDVMMTSCGGENQNPTNIRSLIELQVSSACHAFSLLYLHDQVAMTQIREVTKSVKPPISQLFSIYKIIAFLFNPKAL